MRVEGNDEANVLVESGREVHPNNKKQKGDANRQGVPFFVSHVVFCWVFLMLMTECNFEVEF